MIGALVLSTWLLALKKRCAGLLLKHKMKGKKEYKTKFNEKSPDWSFLLDIFGFKDEDDYEYEN